MIDDRGAITVEELIKELQEMPEYLKKAKVIGLHREYLNNITVIGKNGRYSFEQPIEDVVIAITNDVLFREELKGVENDSKS